MPHVTHTDRWILPALLIGAALALAFEQPPPQKATPPAYRLSGPYTEGNLTIFLIHGDDQVKGKDFLTLDEALAQKKAVVHETQQVNELSIENLSDKQEVFVQAGDIVKGGQQDRTIAFDLIVPPKSGKVPLKSFCVESGRWTRRGAEDASQFGSSKDNLPTNSAKLAARKEMKQEKVWENVSKAQAGLGRRIMPGSGSAATGEVGVRAAQSPTSLQLTLEHKKVLEATDAYVKKLQDGPKGKGDVIGYAACINGKVNNAEVYACNSLFVKLWPKLLKASAVEAVAEKNMDRKAAAPTAEAVQAFLADVDKGKRQEKKINERLQQVERETPAACLFETRDRAQNGAAVRKSYVGK
jgi:hypothetical protein